MDKISNRKETDNVRPGWILKSLFVAYIITAAALCILAFALYRWNLEETKISIGIFAAYLLSTFAGGFVMGKFAKTRKFLWGMTVGALYFLLLLLISFLLYRNLENGGMRILITFFICAGGGMLGGMVS